MKPHELPIYLVLPEHHPGLPDVDLLDLVASHFPAEAWGARIAEQGALPVAFEHARWLLAHDPAPLVVPVSAFAARTFSFAHGVLNFTLDDLLRWFVDHGCVDASEVETLPTDPPPTPPDWTPNATSRTAPVVAELQEHWLYDAEDPYAVLEAMGDTPERPVLTVGHDDSEEPYPYVEVPVRHALDARADVERRVPTLVTGDRCVGDEDEDETLRAMATALREVGFVLTDENLVPAVASWVDDYECGI